MRNCSDITILTSLFGDGDVLGHVHGHGHGINVSRSRIGLCLQILK